MELNENLRRAYSRDTVPALKAQYMAQFIAFGPVIFQTARIMIKSGIMEALRDSKHGLTVKELCEISGLSEYAVTCLLEASLSIGIVLVNPDTDRFRLSKTGWFLLSDASTRVNIDFNHDVNYRGWFDLDKALETGKPAGLKTLGDWPTVYQGLSQLPVDIRTSWLAFDHFYSDNSFRQALEIVFANRPRTLLDVGGNTGRWSLQCVAYDPEVEVTILDLPGQIGMMLKNIEGQPGADRINGIGVDLLDDKSKMPVNQKFDAVWMSQFLDCFSPEQITEILRKTSSVLAPDGRLYIMETLWDRQHYETSALCLTLTSLYFTAIANGNSKMYSTEQISKAIMAAGLEIESIHDNLGLGHSILVCNRMK